LHSPVAAEILFSRDNDRLQVWSGGSGSKWMKLAVLMDESSENGASQCGPWIDRKTSSILNPWILRVPYFQKTVVWAGVSWYFSFKRIFEEVVTWCLKVKLACYFNFLKLKFFGYAVERSLGWFPSNILSTQSGCRDLNLPETQLFRSPQVQRSMDGCEEDLLSKPGFYLQFSGFPVSCFLVWFFLKGHSGNWNESNIQLIKWRFVSAD
jgi:hypothetical protein